MALRRSALDEGVVDLCNQIALASEADYAVLGDHGIFSIDGTNRIAQNQFNRWLDMSDRSNG